MCPLTIGKQSDWGEENWVKLANILEKNKLQYNCIGYKPKGVNGQIITPSSTIDFIQNLSKYSLVICIEGGTSHIAPALLVLESIATQAICKINKESFIDQDGVIFNDNFNNSWMLLSIRS